MMIKKSGSLIQSAVTLETGNIENGYLEFNMETTTEALNSFCEKHPMTRQLTGNTLLSQLTTGLPSPTLVFASTLPMETEMAQLFTCGLTIMVKTRCLRPTTTLRCLFKRVLA